MVVLELIIYAESENIEKVVLPQNYMWHFAIQCSHCHQSYEKQVYFSDLDQHETKSDKGVFNFVSSCKNCKRTGTIKIQKGIKPEALADQNGRIKGSIGQFQCRGIQLKKFNPGTSLIAISQAGTEFEDVDVSDIWVEYDEKDSSNIQLQNVKFQILKVK